LPFALVRRQDVDHLPRFLAVQLGVQGLLAFLFLLYVILATLYRAFKAANENSILYAAMIALVTGFFIRNMFDDLYVDDSAQLFWVLIATAMAVFAKIDKLVYERLFPKFRILSPRY